MTKKNNFNSKRCILASLIVMIVLQISAAIYIKIYGLSDEDILNMTHRFWIFAGLVVLGYDAVYACILADSIRKRDYLSLFVEIIQGVIVVIAVVYWHLLDRQAIAINQSIQAQMQIENYDVALQLTNIKFDLDSKRRLLSLLIWFTVLPLNFLPSLIRKVLNWANKEKKRGEDQ